MSSLSNPVPMSKDDPNRIINYKKYESYRTLGSFIIEGEDAYWLERLARENDPPMTADAFVKVLVMEGLFRRRSYLGLGS